MKARLRQLAGKLARAERGTALVTAMGAMVAVSAFSVALTAGVATNTGQSRRDKDVKLALAASEAGVQEATYRLNMLQPSSDSPCVTLSGGTLVTTSAAEDGWCNSETVDLGNGVTASYRISPYDSDGGMVTRGIVSTGSVRGRTRRVEVTTSANTGAPLFAPYAMSSNDVFSLSGNSNVTGAIRSNNNINMSGNARVCGAGAAATPGPGHTVNISGLAEVCGGNTTPATENFPVNPVDQGDAPSNNDNGRFFAQDPKSPTGVSWSPSTRQLSMSGNGTLNMGGHTYSLCKLALSGNSHLSIAASAEVRIFIDSASACGLTPSSVTQFSISGNGKITNLSGDPTHLQIYMVGGSPGSPNSASMSGNALVTTQLAFYAPYTNLSLSGNSSFNGAFVANRITMSGNSGGITYNDEVEDITAETIGVYQRQNYVECTPAPTGQTPDSGC